MKSNWMTGPSFLWQNPVKFSWEKTFEINEKDTEVRKPFFIETRNPLLKRLEKFSRWKDVVSAVSIIN
jgi:hypothetical protein